MGIVRSYQGVFKIISRLETPRVLRRKKIDMISLSLKVINCSQRALLNTSEATGYLEKN